MKRSIEVKCKGSTLKRGLKNKIKNFKNNKIFFKNHRV